MDFRKFFKLKIESKKIPNHVEMVKNGDYVTFVIPAERGTAFKGSLDCQLNEVDKILIARTIVVGKDHRRQGLGEKLFIAAIDYARNHQLRFETDYGLTGAAVGLIEHLITQGYPFIKNKNAHEKVTHFGTGLVTSDGSAVYILEK